MSLNELLQIPSLVLNIHKSLQNLHYDYRGRLNQDNKIDINSYLCFKDLGILEYCETHPCSRRLYDMYKVLNKCLIDKIFVFITKILLHYPQDVLSPSCKLHDFSFPVFTRNIHFSPSPRMILAGMG